MKRITRFIRRYKFRFILAAITSVVLIACCALFILLIKVGNIKYLYNYRHDTRGSLPVEQELQNQVGANRQTAQAAEETKPSNYQITTKLLVDNKEVTNFERKDPIFFETKDLVDFSKVEGMITFRGNYSRSMYSYGTTSVNDKKFDRDYWSFKTGKVLKSNGVDYWSGNGWTGQPLIVRWEESTRKIMNLYETSKNKEDLVEVIYAGMDGFVHFLDMQTGQPTRDPINIGMTFKGTASLHPDGIPMLVLGSGDAQTGMFGEYISPEVYIYSLIDGTRLYEFGGNDELAPRIWHAFDSSPIFSTATDTLIYPGENGVLYTLKLNTNYDKMKGTLSIAPSELVRFTYTPERYIEDGMWGSECSASIWGNYLFCGDNGGMVYCLDINTMEFVWVQDVLEDVNSSILFDMEEDGEKYIYVATTLKFHADSHSMGEAAIYKFNAMNGKLIWKKPYEVHTVKGLAGGVLSSGIILKGALSDHIIYSVSKTPTVDGGYLVSLDKRTGEENWRLERSAYSWSSGSVVYTDNAAYLIQGYQNGDLLLIDASNGTILDRMNFGTGIEATPVVFENKIIFGTRNEQIIGVTIR